MNKLEKELFKNQDLKYRDFTSSLTPGFELDFFIGVRVPILRQIAKRMYKEENYKSFLKEVPHKYHEEYVIHSLLINEIKDYDDCINELNRFVPYINNWAVSDTIRPKVFNKNKDILINTISEYITSNKTYTLRVGILLLMTYYLDESFDEKYLEMVSKVKSNEYYVNMMIAWYFATALAKQKEKTLPYLEKYKLDKWVHNKTISKAIESFRISNEDKQYLKTLRIK